MRALLFLAALLAGSPAFAQRVGSLDARNSLGEIAAGGSAAQTAARGNLGLGSVATANVGTAGASVPLLNGANVWSGVQAFTVVPNGTGITALFASPPAIGGTAPAAGSFTTLSTTDVPTFAGTPTGAGITSLFASPPAIGATTPAAGSFTTLNTSGVPTFAGKPTGAGITSMFASPPAIGSTAAGTAAFTTLTTSGAPTFTGTPNGAGVTALFASPPAIGGTAPGTGAFTTLSTTGAPTFGATPSGAGVTSMFASPPAIGSTTPAAGSFTSLSASGVSTFTGTPSGAGITSMFASPPAIGGTAPGSGAFTTLSTTGAATIGAGLTAGTGTFSNTLTGSNGFVVSGSNTAANAFLFANGTAAGQRGVRLQTAGVDRWRLMAATTEPGSNVGSDLFLQSYTDGGVGTNLLTITRSNGLFTHNARGLFHNSSTSDVSNETGFVGWNHIASGRNSKIGLTGQIDNLGYSPTTVPAWVTGTAYTANTSAVVVGFNVMHATSSGTSGATPPNCSVKATTCSDGGVSWAFEATLGAGPQMVGGFMTANMNATYGGTPSAPMGTVFGFNTQANISVANGNGVIGYENNFGLAFPARYRIGEQIIAGVSGTNQGSDDDIGWRIANQQGAAAYRNLMDWGSRTTGLLLDPNGYGLRAWSQGWDNGGSPSPSMLIGAGAIDLAEFQATGTGRFGGGFIFRGPGSQILGNGDFQSNNALLHKTATGSSLDVSQYQVSSVAVHPGGGGTTWAASGWLADCTDGSVVKITSVSGGAVTGVSLFLAAFASAPIATVTCTSEQYVGGSDSVGNALLPDAIQIDETWVLANSGSPILTLGGTAKVSISPTGGDTTVGGTLTTNGCKWTAGTGSPNGAVSGSPCDLYTNKSGGAGATMWVKESGSATNTGWIAK